MKIVSRPAMLTAMVAVAALLSACSQGSATAPQNDAAPAASTSAPAAASASDPAPSESENNAATSNAAEPAATASISYLNFSANGGHEEDLDAIVAAFEKENPGITVKVENVPYADYFTKLQTAVAGGTASDAFELNYENFITYAEAGALAELPDTDSTVYRKSLYDAFTMDGKQYGLPESFSDVVLFYNKTLFDKAGVDAPTADWTWADEKAAAEKLTDKTAGVWGDYQPISYNEFYKALAQTGGSFFNADKTEAAFNSPEGVTAANWLIGKSGTVMPTEADGAGTPDFDTNLFKDGKLAMWHTGIWMFSGLAEVPFDWDIVVEPGDTTKASAMFTNAAVVSATSPNAAAAQKWVEFLTGSAAAATTRLNSSWELPPVADNAQLAPYLETGKPANRQAVFDALDNTILPPVISAQQEMQDTVNDALTGAAAGTTKVEDALSAAADEVTSLMNE